MTVLFHTLTRWGCQCKCMRITWVHCMDASFVDKYRYSLTSYFGNNRLLHIAVIGFPSDYSAFGGLLAQLGRSGRWILAAGALAPFVLYFPIWGSSVLELFSLPSGVPSCHFGACLYVPSRQASRLGHACPHFCQSPYWLFQYFWSFLGFMAVPWGLLLSTHCICCR